MATREELKAEYDKKLAELDQSEAIQLALPDSVLPKLKHVTIQHRSAPWVGFRNEGYGYDAGMTMQEAMAIFDAFGTKVLMEHRKGTFTSIKPRSEYKASELEGPGFKGAFCADIRHQGASHEGRFANDMELVFYAMVGKTMCRIYVELKPVFLVRPTETRGYRDRLESRVFNFNNVLYSQADGWISYGCYENGPVKKTWDHHFLIVADDEECTKFDHFRGVMQTLANEARQEWKDGE